MTFATSFYMFSRAFDLEARAPTGGLSHSERPRYFLAFERGRTALRPACCRRGCIEQALMHPRRGQLSRESKRLGITREVHFSDISFRVYRFAQEFSVANPASTTCRLCLESSVETSTPPFLG